MILQGTCHALFAFDVGREIALSVGESRLASPVERATFRHKHPTALGGPIAHPLRVSLPEGPRPCAGFATVEGVEIALYSFGAIGISWRIAVRSTLEQLIALSTALYANEDLMRRSREICAQVLAKLGEAVLQPGISGEVEDYVIFQIAGSDGQVGSREDLARLLRAESGALSDQEVDNALANQVSYAEGEKCYVDWLCALLLGNDMEDERRVLEFATVELLELRFLESQLERGIDEAYVALHRMRGPVRRLASKYRELERLARLEADNAVLHDSIDNASKLLGDDYLARLYRNAAERFHFDEWDASIERKLGVLHGIYAKLEDVAGRRRAEVLEWLIIGLIAVEILLSWWPKG